jgi:hypothetical protein
VERVRRVSPDRAGGAGSLAHLEALARARVSSITEVVAVHTPGLANVEGRAHQIRSAARDWVEFWNGHLDLDALAWETAELLADLTAADARVDRATEATRDLNGTPVTRREATKLAAALAVPDDIRRRTRAHSAATHRARLTR